MSICEIGDYITELNIYTCINYIYIYVYIIIYIYTHTQSVSYDNHVISFQTMNLNLGAARGQAPGTGIS